MIRRHGTALRAALMLADMVGAVLVFVVAAGLRVGPASWPAALGQAAGEPWLVALSFGAAWVIALWLRGLYRMRARWSLRREALDIVAVAVVLGVAILALLFLVRFTDVSRLFVLTLLAGATGVTIVSRAALRRSFAWARTRGANRRYVLVVGTGPAAQGFADLMEHHAALGLGVIGHLDAGSEAGRQVSRPVLGTLDDLERILHERVVDEVAVCLPGAAWSLLEDIVGVCEQEGRVVRVPLGAHGPVFSRGQVEELEGQPVLSLARGPDRAVALLAKRALDVAVAGAALLVLAPVWLAVALVIRVVDGPPIIFRQRRVGLHGRQFTMLKFRSMTVDAEERLPDLAARNEIEGPAFKVTDDPRLSRTGAFLRRTSLDEIPQLWNVLRGEMSLVGPRPPLPDEVAGYDQWHRRRLSMKPGITGLWQVEGRREAVFDRWVRMDLEYIDRWSLRLDLLILLRTIPAVLLQQGR